MLLKGLGALGLMTALPACRQAVGDQQRASDGSQAAAFRGRLGGSSVLHKLADADALDGFKHLFLPYVGVSNGSAADELNFILVMCDTLRYDYLGCNGNRVVQTPNIDAFAATAQVFEKSYAGSFPTVPNRSEIITSRYVFSYLGWEDLPSEEVVLAEFLNAAGYTTGIVFDTLHIRNEFTLDREYDTWEWVRGQENDRYRAMPLDPELPAPPEKLRHGPEVLKQYLRNVSDRSGEEEYFMARTVRAATEWLRRNAGINKFFLHIDMFDPHEPWDPPSQYVELYDLDYHGDEIIYPAYAPASFFSSRELQHIQALYAAEVTMVDQWLGVLFATLGALDPWDNTVVILTSDHGILLGEHDAVGKSLDHQGRYECYPLFEELARIPLMIRVPRLEGWRRPTLAQPVDIMPTILDLARIQGGDRLQGVSLRSAIESDSALPVNAVRPVAVTSRSLKLSISSSPTMAVTDGEWCYMHGGSHTSSFLYDMVHDPRQIDNVIGAHTDVARRLYAELIAFLESIGTSASLLSTWQRSP